MSYYPVPSTSYGFKYCIRFSRILSPKLSTKGQKWLVKARFKLQELIEQGIISKNYISKSNEDFNDKFYVFDWTTFSKKIDYEKVKEYYENIEISNTEFQYFAFATHPDAYNSILMSQLSVQDLLKIILTPDMKEWMGAATWEQAWILAKNLNYGNILQSTINQTINDLLK